MALARRALKPILKSANLVRSVQKSIDNLPERPELAGIEDLALEIARLIDASETEVKPLASFSEDDLTDAEFHNRIRQMETLIRRQRAIRDLGPQLIKALTELGAVDPGRGKTLPPANSQNGGDGDVPRAVSGLETPWVPGA